MKLPKTYNPQEYESDIYALWEKSNAFAPSGKGESFSVVMPPPNANAGLHIGHVLGFGIQDTLVRYNRMKGRDAVWLPGADHAGFETQVVYEKHLAKEGKSRFDFSREELYDQIAAFVGKNREGFYQMFRQFGASCDWDHFTYTLDDVVVKTAYSTFKKMWDDGLIYRGERLVNYCTEHRTGFADIEVVHEERTSPLYYLKYGPFTIATTRPETRFGDTAIAVHPKDTRYTQYINTTVTVEGLDGPLELRVVGDDFVDPEFGTGAVKITPAHDFNDWEVAQRHNLQAVRVINHDGTLNHEAGEFAGMTVLEARKAVVEKLKEKDLLEKVDEKYQNRVSVCYKCGTHIEPMLLDQWFVDMKTLAKPAIKALKDKKIAFYPQPKREQTIRYLEGVHDWNISRQVAWGIPIPAFQNVNDPDDWIFDENVQEELIERDGKTYHRDPDVFDTWFSSGHWPIVTTGYGLDGDMKRHYPTTLMETGIDILNQWVARMICIGLYTTGEIPFKDVYLHGMVRGEDGRKMSKSIGNVVDPMPLIAEHGADATRVGIMNGRSAGDSAAYDPSKIVAARNFCNKLWNVARFIENTLEGQTDKASDEPKSNVDHWMLSKLQHTIETISSLLDEYRMSEAYEVLYHFVWDDFADWYVEASKTQLNAGFLRGTFETVLKLAHPFVPFVSETIWQTLPWVKDTLLVSQEWPKAGKYDKKQAEEFEEIRKIVLESRAIISAMQLKKTSLFYTDVPFLEAHSAMITRLAGIAGVHEVEDGSGLHLTSTTYRCWLDIDRERAEQYAKKLAADKESIEKRLEGLRQRLENKSYVANAPKELVAETKAQVTETEQLLENLEREIVRFKA